MKQGESCFSFATCYYDGAAGRYARAVSTIQDIRRANLRFLLEEVADDIGAQRGAAAELSRRAGISAPFISQYLNYRTHSGGKERLMGDGQARQIEQGVGKPLGWMDVDRTVATDWKEAALLDKLRLLTQDQRAAIEALADQLLSR